ncbi:hypothetical protein SAMN05661091_0697 [Paenibacillus uliginis N3/975]|uniref:Uncharacterized protein n=1 Tax=Paenibacillus uliginis N3/975 TaxID=1313296 RepID=A0A1X7GKJ6_9BACL|nr:hypothetical protein [Paenibacillus uliginis]SMF71216.1 hypothetical protein SAMN05661091_0697 [Paenibacillus uliginis N3/975]
MKDNRLLQLVEISAVRHVENESSAVNSPDIQLTKSVVWHRLFRGNESGTQPWQDRLNEYRQNK